MNCRTEPELRAEPVYTVFACDPCILFTCAVPSAAFIFHRFQGVWAVHYTSRHVCTKQRSHDSAAIESLSADLHLNSTCSRFRYVVVHVSDSLTVALVQTEISQCCEFNLITYGSFADPLALYFCETSPEVLDELAQRLTIGSDVISQTVVKQ